MGGLIMKVRPFIDMRNIEICGNVLDMGLENCGIIYNIYKLKNNESNFETRYIEGSKKMEGIEESYYDCCINFFTLRFILSSGGKARYLSRIYDILRDTGYLYIWDIEKSFGKTFSGKVRVMLPDRRIMTLNFTDNNIFKNCSMKNTIKLIEQRFEVVDTRAWDGIYFIKAKKRTKGE
jgi:hypothetical protein